MDHTDERQKLLQELITISDDDAILSFIRTHHTQLLTAETDQQLAKLAAAADDDTQRQKIIQRQQLIQTLSQMQAIADLPPAEQLFVAFMTVSNADELSNLILRVNDQVLDELEQLVATRQEDAQEDEAEAIRQRLDDLRQIRQQLQVKYGKRLPLVRHLHAWLYTDTWEESQAYLQKYATDILSNDAEEALQQLLHNDPDNPMLLQHQTLLHESRTLGIKRAYANFAERAQEQSLDPEQAQALADKLITWIQQESLGEAEAYLREHETELMIDEGIIAMQMLVQANPNNPNVSDHLQRLVRAQEVGIATAYVEIRRQRLLNQIQEALQQQGPIGVAIFQYIQTEDDNTAISILQSQSNLLLTRDTGQLLNELVQQVKEHDETLFAQWKTRRQLWQTTYTNYIGHPLRPIVDIQDQPQQTSPETWSARTEQEAIQTERGSEYTIISAHNCAIGDNALVINNIGQLPLRWRRPTEGRPRLAQMAVGREAELTELHQRLTTKQGTAVVSQGTSAALRGQPAIGKTTLAAMYAHRSSSHYPGGVLWLEVGPDRRSSDSAMPILQRIATYAYDADPQASALLKETVFAPDVVKALLDDHGPLLVVIDDVWDPAVLNQIQDALPSDASILLTTRDYHVAYALEHSDAAIQRLDVLSPLDARSLLQKGAIGLSKTLADRVAAGLGYHAQALVLAAGALQYRKAHRYQQTAAELLRRVSAGQGFGDLPRMDQAERLTEIEIAVKFSYDELGASVQGPQRQAWFRGLGTFAQEADFDTSAAATIWESETNIAEEFLLLLDGLGLLQEGTAGERWQQHAILRAYALSLQTVEERILFPERHADHYIKLTQLCHQRKPRDYDRVDQEFAQIQHAFSWCKKQSPRRATHLTLILDDFMRIRGRVGLLNQWLQVALHGAEIHGDRLGTANTLKSLGDLESRLGNIEQARQHYAAALPLFEAEQDRLGTANTLQSLGDLESRLGNIEQARQHYDAALPLYEAEQARLGTANTLKSLGDLERRLGNIEQARQHYDAALPLFEAEQDRLGTANTLRSLGDLERRLGNIEQARQHYAAALPLYEAEQARLGTANTLQSLGDLESRLGNIEQARQHYAAALPLYEAEQARLGTANTLRSLGIWKAAWGTSSRRGSITTPPCPCTKPSKPAWAQPTP